jgi:hypothetical protein
MKKFKFNLFFFAKIALFAFISKACGPVTILSGSDTTTYVRLADKLQLKVLFVDLL